MKNFDIVEDDLTTTRHRWDDVTLKIRNCGIYPNIKKAKVLGWISVLKVSKDSRSPVFLIYIVKKSSPAGKVTLLSNDFIDFCNISKIVQSSDE